ncbi:MAG: hypothetical protein ACT4N8_14105 [Sphingosinicella sp.]|uniref:hypothetical protein n=1 Tax=Sphingosinicella sp. TaxID=1917971 RepID=UPI00403778CB
MAAQRRRGGAVLSQAERPGAGAVEAATCKEPHMFRVIGIIALLLIGLGLLVVFGLLDAIF